MLVCRPTPAFDLLQRNPAMVPGYRGALVGSLRFRSRPLRRTLMVRRRRNLDGAAAERRIPCRLDAETIVLNVSWIAEHFCV